jgi:hypothetical protein
MFMYKYRYIRLGFDLETVGDNVDDADDHDGCMRSFGVWKHEELLE